jgi:hypothetical protein
MESIRQRISVVLPNRVVRRSLRYAVGAPHRPIVSIKFVIRQYGATRSRRLVAL